MYHVAFVYSQMLKAGRKMKGDERKQAIYIPGEGKRGKEFLKKYTKFLKRKFPTCFSEITI